MGSIPTNGKIIVSHYQYALRKEVINQLLAVDEITTTELISALAKVSSFETVPFTEIKKVLLELKSLKLVQRENGADEAHHKWYIDVDRESEVESYIDKKVAPRYHPVLESLPIELSTHSGEIAKQVVEYIMSQEEISLNTFYSKVEKLIYNKSTFSNYPVYVLVYDLIALNVLTSNSVYRTDIYKVNKKSFDMDSIYSINSLTPITTKIQIGYYTNFKKFPDSVKTIEKQLLDELENTFVGTMAQLEAKKAEIAELAKQKRTEQMRIYKEGESEVWEKFRTDLEDEFGVTDNPKKGLLYSKAYSLGHSGGFSEIYSYYSELVELIEE